jgi:dTMP kinase
MGKFIMVDGLDGSGKGVVVDALKQWAVQRKLNVIDLREYWKSKEGFPDIINYDVIISAEPTFTGWGKKIRENLIKTGSKASKEEIAEAYSNDRKELYKRIIIPALKQNKFIFQDRGVISSLVYQSVQGIPVDDILALDGNRFCLEHPPHLLIITVVNPEVVMERIENREKKDNSMFEKLEFQKKIKSVYESDWLRQIFENMGAKVVYLDTNPPSTPEDTKKKAIEILERNI